jgi:cytochrome c biogenesis protein CcmG, thiol:disulfide interchange protein DsbE
LSETHGPRRLRALLIGSVIAAALAIFLFFGLRTTSGSTPGSGAVVPIGSVAPAFTLPSLTGGPPVDLYVLGRDAHRPVVLNFFASWCTPCQKETPLLARSADAERAKGSVVRFVGVDVADQHANAIAFVDSSGITYPVATDADLTVTSGLYGLNGEPNTFFIDASGDVVGHVIGAVTPAQLQGWLHRLAGSAG